MPDFLENVRVEVVENIRRLRHRASLALWCGNNEMEWGWVDWGWDKPEYQDLKAAYDRFFHHTLPAWCAAEDPDHCLLAQFAVVGYAFRGSERPAAGERTLLGCLAWAQAVHRLPRTNTRAS